MIIFVMSRLIVVMKVEKCVQSVFYLMFMYINTYTRYCIKINDKIVWHTSFLRRVIFKYRVIRVIVHVMLS